MTLGIFLLTRKMPGVIIGTQPSCGTGRMQLRTMDIKAEMTRRGYTAAKLARELGVHRSTVTRVISGEYSYPRVLAALAALLGVDVRDLAPGPATSICPEHIGYPQGGSTQNNSEDSALTTPRHSLVQSDVQDCTARRAAGGRR